MKSGFLHFCTRDAEDIGNLDTGVDQLHLLFMQQVTPSDKLLCGVLDLCLLNPLDFSKTSFFINYGISQRNPWRSSILLEQPKE